MASQWERLLKNQGIWVGSFTQISPRGEVLQDTPTVVALLPLNEGNTLRQEIRKYPVGQPPSETVLEYSSLGRGVLFCEDGAFSQGSIQWSPVSEFGAELGLIYQRERLRLAQVFPRQPQIGGLTLIREHWQGTTPTPRPPLTVDQLLGTWVGQAVTVFPDYQPEQTLETQLTIEAAGDTEIAQTLSFGGGVMVRSQGQRQGSALGFTQGRQPITVLLLPGGASATFPTAIQPGQSFFLEVGWLITPTLRQRLIRTYNAQGTWVSLTAVVEHRQEN